MSVGKLSEIRRTILSIILSSTFIISYVTLLVTITIGYWVVSHERPDERFLGLSTLGKNDTKTGYYPSFNDNNYLLADEALKAGGFQQAFGPLGDILNVGDPIVLPGQKVPWNVHVYNHAGRAEYVSIRIKLLNSTDSLADKNYSGEPRGHYLHEFTRLLARNSSWNIPLSWTISNVSADQPNHRHVTVKGMDINNYHVDGLNVTSPQGKDLRMIIELWKYNMKDKAFAFQGFPENDNNKGAWNQVWFDLKV